MEPILVAFFVWAGGRQIFSRELGLGFVASTIVSASDRGRWSFQTPSDRGRWSFQTPRNENDAYCETTNRKIRKTCPWVSMRHGMIIPWFPCALNNGQRCVQRSHTEGVRDRRCFWIAVHIGRIVRGVHIETSTQSAWYGWVLLLGKQWVVVMVTKFPNPHSYDHQ